MTEMETPKTAGFVQRGSNYARKQKKMEEEENEIARLEAEARGEEFVEGKSNSEDTKNTKVQTASDTQQKEQEPSKGEVQADDDSGLSAEEKSFKKRYGDLRRHMQEKDKEWNEKMEALENKKANNSYVAPKSDEDIAAWQKKYPDVAGIVEKIAAKKAKEMFGKSEELLKELDEAHNEALRMKAENQIRKSHEDFDDLRQSDDFHNWAEEQPKWVKDALYENADDPASVVRVIDLYKIDNGMTSVAKKNNRKAAASSITKGTRTSIDAKGVSGQIKESDVAKMSNKQFEENLDSINEAMSNGKFVYDVSGGAR